MNLKQMMEAALNEARSIAQKAKDEAEKTELVNKVVEAKLLTEAVANGLTLEALRELAPKGTNGSAANLHGNMQQQQDPNGGFKLPAAAK